MPFENFHDAALDNYISFGCKIRVKFQTFVTRMRQGHEERIGEWQDPLWGFDITPALRDQADLDTLIAFFRARNGPEFIFKFHNPLDYQVTNELFGVGDGFTTTFQLSRRYNSGISGDSYYYVRPIMLPDIPLQIYDNGVLQLSSFDYNSIDITMGIVRFQVAPLVGHTLMWTGTYKVPVRFGNNHIYSIIEHYQNFEDQIILVEERLPLTGTVQTEPQPPDFVEARFPEYYAQRASMGPEMDVIVTQSDSGLTTRIRQFIEPKIKFTVEESEQSLAIVQSILAFFLNRKGRLVGFRAKDISDYQAINQLIAVSDGVTYSLQLVKHYTSGSQVGIRTITKPVTTPTVYENAVPSLLGNVDVTTGRVTFPLTTGTLAFVASTKRITRLTGSWTADGVVSGRKVIIVAVGSAVNDGIYTVDVVVSTTVISVLEAVVDQAATVYGVQYPPASGVTLTWTGEFDVPVRFDVDEATFSIKGYEWFNLEALSLAEIPLALPDFTLNIPTVDALSCVLPARPRVTSYMQFISAGPGDNPLLRIERLGDMLKIARGATSVTFAVLVSHMNDTLAGDMAVFSHMMPEGVPGFVPKVGLYGNGVTIDATLGGYFYDSSPIPIYDCQALLGSIPVFTKGDFTTVNTVVNNNRMHAYIMTMDWYSRKMYVSGTFYGIGIFNEANFFFQTCYQGKPPSTPIAIKTSKSYRFVSAIDFNIGLQPTNDCWLGGIRIFPNSGDFTNPFIGYMYEHLFVPSYRRASQGEILKNIHLPILQYWGSKYGTGYPAIQSPAVVAVDAYWYRADENIIIADNSTKAVGRWEPVRCGFSWTQSIPAPPTDEGQPRQLPITVYPTFDDILLLADGRPVLTRRC